MDLTEGKQDLDLFEGLQIEMDRCWTLLGHYEAIPGGKFASTTIELEMVRAKKAMDEGDTIEMIKCLISLKQLE